MFNIVWLYICISICRGAWQVIRNEMLADFMDQCVSTCMNRLKINTMHATNWYKVFTSTTANLNVKY